MINDDPINWRQYVVVFIMIALNALDGFDVLSSAFAAPGITQEWGATREALGIVLSAELLGVTAIMAIGSMISAILLWMLPIRDADADLADIPAGKPMA